MHILEHHFSVDLGTYVISLDQDFSDEPLSSPIDVHQTLILKEKADTQYPKLSSRSLWLPANRNTSAHSPTTSTSPLPLDNYMPLPSNPLFLLREDPLLPPTIGAFALTCACLPREPEEVHRKRVQIQLKEKQQQEQERQKRQAV